MRQLTLILSAAALALPGAAFAQSAPRQAAPAQARAPQADVTRAEAQARAERAYARMDANQDGTIDGADRVAMRGQMFERLDTDGDGSISRAEFEAKTAGRPGARAGKRGGQRVAVAPATRQAFVDRALKRFDRADANRDGIVTVAERQAAREAMRRERQAPSAAPGQG